MIKIKLLTYLVLLFILIKCANQLPPTGGEVDRIPPEIIDVYPQNNTVNFTDDHVELEFSEYVDKRSVQDAIFISPYIESGVKYEWSGRSVEIFFKDSLKQNTTYTISIGTNVKDLNNGNKMANAFIFAFSTGPEIDRGKIKGKVYADNLEGTMIFAYRLDSSDVNPSIKKPDYITQVGLDGSFKLLGLTYDKYRIFAIRDKFKDLLYNVGDDWFGVPFEDIELTKKDSVFGSLKFKMTREDTIPPHISKIVMTDINHILVEFDDSIDSTKVSASNFYIYDSTAQKKLSPKYFYKKQNNIKKYFLILDSTLQAGNNNYLLADSIPDNFGNVLKAEKVEFTATEKLDTNAVKVLKIIGNYEKNLLDPDKPSLELFFDDAVSKSSLIQSVKWIENSRKNIQFNIQKIDDASFKLIPITKLKQKKKYKLKIDFNRLVDISGNKTDTTIVYEFQTINTLNYSGAYGKIKTSKDLRNLIIELISIDDKNRKYDLRTKTSEFNFDKVYPGKYLLWYFSDRDSNNAYSYGSIYPFIPSEKFGYYSDTLNLRARWPVGDLVLNSK